MIRWFLVGSGGLKLSRIELAWGERMSPYVPMARFHSTQALFNRKTLDQALKSTEFRPSDEQVQAALGWALRAKDPAFAREKEVALQGLFKSEIVERVLGYKPFASGSAYTVVAEHPAGAGSVAWHLVTSMEKAAESWPRSN